jgi:hypothetical protein
MYALLLEVLNYLVASKDPCINIDVHKIIVYVWGRNLSIHVVAKW